MPRFLLLFGQTENLSTADLSPSLFTNINSFFTNSTPRSIQSGNLGRRIIIDRRIRTIETSSKLRDI